MAKLTLDISVSLDGFIAGPNRTLDEGLGEGGEQLHQWAVGVPSWRAAHGPRPRRFEDLGNGSPKLECIRVIESPAAVTHLRYRILH